MRIKEKDYILQKYENLLDLAEDCYNRGSPVDETFIVESKIELLKELMGEFNIPFEE